MIICNKKLTVIIKLRDIVPVYKVSVSFGRTPEFKHYHRERANSQITYSYQRNMRFALSLLVFSIGIVLVAGQCAQCEQDLNECEAAKELSVAEW